MSELAECMRVSARPAESADAGIDVAVPDIAGNRQGTSRNVPASCAALSAKPFSKSTLMFGGAVGASKEAVNERSCAAPPEAGARVLLDTGSSHCFIDKEHAEDMPLTGRSFTVNLAKQGAFVTAVPEVMMQVQIGDYTAALPALKPSFHNTQYARHTLEP